MTEKQVRARITRYLKSVPGLVYYPIIGSAYGRRGSPDIVGFYKGTGFGMEIKSSSGKATPIQLHEGQSIRATGNLWAVVRCVGDARALLAMAGERKHG